MEAVAIDVTTSTSGIAANGTIKFGLLVKRSPTDASSSPGLIDVCGTSDISLGVADDDILPKTTTEYYNIRDLVRVLQSGTRCRAWLASGNAVTRGWYMQRASSGELEPETLGNRTATSFCQAMESKSSSASSQQIEVVIV